MPSPYSRPKEVRVQAALAADATADQNVAVAPVTGTITAASYTPDTVLTGADTNSATLEIINKGAAGAGTQQVAAKAFTAGVNAPAADETALTLTATVSVTEGDVIAFRRTKVGTGLATPAALVRVTFAAAS